MQDNIRQNVTSDNKNLKVFTCVQIPVASIALDLSCPFAISSRVAKTESNVLQTASTAKYLQDQNLKVSAIVSVTYLAVIQTAS